MLAKVQGSETDKSRQLAMRPLHDGQRVATLARPPHGRTPPSILERLPSPPKYPALPPVQPAAQAAGGTPRAGFAAGTKVLGHVPAPIAGVLLQFLSPYELVALVQVSKAHDAVLRGRPEWKTCALAFTALPKPLHAGVVKRYGCWHAYCVGVLRALHDVAGVIGLPRGYHRWCTVCAAPAGSHARAVVVAAMEPEPPTHGARGGRGVAAGTTAADEASWQWVEFPRVVRATWGARLARRGDALQLSVDGDFAGDIPRLGVRNIVLWRGGDEEISGAYLQHGLGQQITVECSDGLYSRVGIQDGLDAGLGWLWWRPQCEETDLWAMYTGHSVAEVRRYLASPDAAPLIRCDLHQGGGLNHQGALGDVWRGWNDDDDGSGSDSAGAESSGGGPGHSGAQYGNEIVPWRPAWQEAMQPPPALAEAEANAKAGWAEWTPQAPEAWRLRHFRFNLTEEPWGGEGEGEDSGLPY